jgi:adenosylhomocysteine nucleosidase
VTLPASLLLLSLFSLSAFADGPKVLVVVGMTHEARIAAGPGVITVVGGGGLAGDADRLRAKLAQVDLRGVESVISLGVTGGFDPALQSGDVVLGTEVRTADGRSWKTDPTIVARMSARLAAAGIKAHKGIVAAEDVVVYGAEFEKFKEVTRGIVVDEESHIAAEFARVHKLPFATLRAVDAPAGMALPPLSDHSLTPNGDIDYAGILGGLLKDPSQLPQLIKVGQAAAKAFKGVTAARCAMRLQDLEAPGVRGNPMSAADVSDALRAQGFTSVPTAGGAVQRVVKDANQCGGPAYPFVLGGCQVGFTCDDTNYE